MNTRFKIIGFLFFMIMILILFQLFIYKKSKISTTNVSNQIKDAEMHSEEYVHRFDTDLQFEKLEKKNYQMIRDFKTSPILIYFNNSNFIKNNQTFGDDILCDIPCKITKKINVENFFLIDGFLSTNEIPFKKPTKRQKTILISNSNLNLKKIKKFDFFISKNFDSSITNYEYFNYKKLNYFKKLYNGKRKMVCSFLNNCQENSIIRNFKSKGIEIDCFEENQIKEIIIEKYFFNLILKDDELNSNYFKTLASASIPIISNIDENFNFFEPQKNFNLKLNSKNLIQEMKKLMSNLNLFKSKFRWKQMIGLKKEFKLILDDSSIDKFCKICQKLGDTVSSSKNLNFLNDWIVSIRSTIG